MSSALVVKAGACIDANNNTFVKCALDSTSCDVTHTFLSSRAIESADVSIRTSLQSCWTATAVQAITIGRCAAASDNKACTSDASNCHFPNNFVTQDITCSVAKDSSDPTQLFQFSSYGLCTRTGAANYCAWSADECTETSSQTWYPLNNPFTQAQGTCECDKVRVGACVPSNNGSPYCATAETACTIGDIYQGVEDLEQNRELACYLCDALAQPAPTAPPTTLAHQEILDAARAEASSSSSDSSDAELKALEAGGVIGIVVGVTVTLLLTGLVLWKRRGSQTVNTVTTSSPNMKEESMEMTEANPNEML